MYIPSLHFVRSAAAGALLLAVSTASGTALSAADQSGEHYLSAPSSGDTLSVAKSYLAAHRSELGLTKKDLGNFRVQNIVESRHNGVTHIYLRQLNQGIEVFNGDLDIHLTRDGRVVQVHHNFISGLVSKTSKAQPHTSARAAVVRAARHLGLDPRAVVRQVRATRNAAKETVLRSEALSSDDIPIRLQWFEHASGEVTLVWNVVLRTPDGQHWWNVLLEDRTGRVAQSIDYYAHAGKQVTEGYGVFAFPHENPYSGPQTPEIQPADLDASPFGWHDIDGVSGPDLSDTRGNNVLAQTDFDGDDKYSKTNEVRPRGGERLLFPYRADLDNDPSLSAEAAVTNLFYWNNILHDVLYGFGFDEPAGNFQFNNYGNGGADGDPVFADALDGSGVNNANFGTPPDGTPPRMQMFRWLGQRRVTVDPPSPIAGDYDAAAALFGAQLHSFGIGGQFELVDDGTPEGSEGCGGLPNFTTGRIALIDRGSCEFGQKVLNAELAGAVAAVVVNNDGDDLLQMNGGLAGDDVTIPALFIGQTDGETLKSQIADATGAVRAGDEPDRDSAFDNGIIIHEYVHGLSNRLTGGPANSLCLFHPEQMGEGWSDWYALALTAGANDLPETARGIGNYVIYEPDTGAGIRNYPYSTDQTVNPQTYADIGSTNVPHGVGEIWGSMLWDLYWNLVGEYGFDADLSNRGSGNATAIQLVTDGMKLQGCLPTFVSARDGILAADLVNSNGANRCLVWNAFANRGLGVDAEAGGLGVGDETESYQLPADCTAP